MSEREYNEIFAENLKRYLDLNDMSQTDLARRLGVSAQSVTNWCAGKKSPRMDKVDAMCKIFGCNRSDLMEVQTLGHPEWYDYPKTTKYMKRSSTSLDSASFWKVLWSYQMKTWICF